MVGMVDGEAPDQIERVLGGAVAFAAAAAQTLAELGQRAALPEEDLDAGDVLGALDGHHDVDDQGAQQLFAVAVGCRLRRLEPRQVACLPGQHAALVWVERCRAGVLECRELALFALDGGKRLLERALEGARDEAVLRLARVELPSRSVCLKSGALERQALALTRGRMFEFGDARGSGIRSSPRWCGGAPRHRGEWIPEEEVRAMLSTFWFVAWGLPCYRDGGGAALPGARAGGAWSRACNGDRLRRSERLRRSPVLCALRRRCSELRILARLSRRAGLR